MQSGISKLEFHDRYDQAYASKLQAEHFSGYGMYRTLFSKEEIDIQDNQIVTSQSAPIHRGYIPAPQPTQEREASRSPSILAEDHEVETRPDRRQSRRSTMPETTPTPSPVKQELPDDIDDVRGSRGRRLVDTKRYFKGKKEINYSKAIEYPNGPKKSKDGKCLTCCYNSRSCNMTDLVWEDKKKVWRCGHCAKPDKKGMSTRICYWKDEARGIFDLISARNADLNGRSCEANTREAKLEKARQRLAEQEEEDESEEEAEDEYDEEDDGDDEETED